MLSIGDLIDKLVIENIKIFTLREKLHEKNISDEDYIQLNDKMITLNENRGIISNFLDEKVNNVVNGVEKNVLLKKIKTYHEHKK
jgi:3-dehydroquinate dehydratase